MNNVMEMDHQNIAQTYRRFPVEIVKGKGALCWDDTGKEYIDMGSGIAVNTLGFCDDLWVEAVTKQLSTLQHTSNLYYTKPGALLAAELCKRTGFKRVFFGNSGAEANECAIKVARDYAQKNKGDDYYQIITLNNSFHGRTLTTLAATGQDVFHKRFLPLTEGFLYAPANDLDAIKKLVNEHSVAAVMLEPVQGEGGVLPLDKDYVYQLSEYLKNNDILLIADEVQTGNGRTGTLYAYEQFGIMPDILTTAKGLGGGLPIGACLLSEKVQDILDAGSHGSTFGANPAVCAGALAVLERITPQFLNEVKEKSSYVFNKLQGQDGIVSVDGMGLMIGVETQKPAAEVIGACRENGVLVLSAKNKVRLLPPLTITLEQLEQALNVILNACAED